jgi:hypothetical protein
MAGSVAGVSLVAMERSDQFQCCLLCVCLLRVCLLLQYPCVLSRWPTGFRTVVEYRKWRTAFGFFVNN